MTLTALLIAFMVQQSIGAMQLGMTQSDIQRTFPSATVVQIEGQPGVTMVNVGDTRRMLTCQGVVNEVQEDIGTTFHDYAATVASETTRRGLPVTETMNARTSAGEMSWLNARWQGEGYTYRITVIVSNSGTSVTRAFTAPSSCQRQR